MPLPTVTVTCRLYEQDGEPAAFATVRFKLTQTDFLDGVVAPDEVRAVADQYGVATVEVFPNALGSVGSNYRVRATNFKTGRRFLDSLAYVPNEDCFLEDVLLIDGEPAVQATPQAITALLATLAAGDGASRIGSKYEDSDSLAVTVASRLGEQVSARFFDVYADGTLSQYTDQVQRAAEYAIARGGNLNFGPGLHVINDIETSGNLRLNGEGQGVTFILLKGANHRWRHLLTGVNDTFTSSGITWLTDGSDGHGLHIKHTVPDAMNPFRSRSGRRVFTTNMEFKGAALVNGWDIPMWLENIQGSLHDNLWIIGSSPDSDDDSEAANTVTPIGVRIDGNDYPTDHRFNKPTFYSMHTCVKVDGYAEGVTLTDAVAVAVGWLAEWDLSTSPAAGRPGMKIVNPHVNSYYGVARVRGIQQFQFLDGEVYHCPGSAPTVGPAKVFTVNTATDVINSTAHLLEDKDEILFVGGVPPGGTQQGVGYFVRDRTSNSFKLAATESGPAIDITSAASGGCQIFKRNVWVAYDISNCVDGHISGNQMFRFADFRGGVKAFTVDTSTDVFTSAAHGMANNDPFEFATGTPPGGTSLGVVYFVRDVTADTFKVAATPGGAAINITSAASGGCFLYKRNGAKTVGVKVRGSLSKGIHIKDNTFGMTDTRSRPVSSFDVGLDLSDMEPGQVHQRGNIFPGEFRVADIMNYGNAQEMGCRGFRVLLGNAQAIPNGVSTLVRFDSPGYDPMGLWAFGPSYYESFTVPRNAGISRVLIGASCAWAASGAGTYRRLEIQINGVAPAGLISIVPPVNSGAIVTTQSIPTQSIPVNGGDVISVLVTHDKGSSLDLSGGNFGSLFFEVVS